MLRRVLFTLLLACALAACSGSAPQLIGSYPSTDIDPVYNPPVEIGGGYQISYDTSMVLEVDNVPIFDIVLGSNARDFDAQVISNRSWQDGTDQINELIVVVPSHRFNELRDWLRTRGTIVSETTFAHVQDTNFITSESYYSTLTLTVRPYGWVKVRNFVMGAFWVVAALIPPALMVIGLITVIRWAVGRFRRRVPPVQST